MPLHPKRLRERGYNQSELLARELAKLNGVPLVADCLIKRQHTVPQAKTESIEQRQSNVSGAFDCRDNRLDGCKVIIVDDVTTSGSTLNACAEALKAKGAAWVWGLTVAREI